jgi:hypothetical protein
LITRPSHPAHHGNHRTFRCHRVLPLASHQFGYFEANHIYGKQRGRMTSTARTQTIRHEVNNLLRLPGFSFDREIVLGHPYSDMWNVLHARKSLTCAEPSHATVIHRLIQLCGVVIDVYNSANLSPNENGAIQLSPVDVRAFWDRVHKAVEALGDDWKGIRRAGDIC